MIRVIYLLLLISCYSLESQIMAQGRQIGIQVNPNLSYRFLKTNGGQFGSAFDSEKPSITYDLGITYLHPITEKFALKSGLSFSRKGFFDKVNLTDEFGAPVGTSKLRYIFKYLEIPLVLKYHIKPEGRLFIEVGILNNFLLSGTLKESPSQSRNQNLTSSFRSYNPGVVVSIGKKLRLSDSLDILLSPTFKSHLTSVFPRNLPVKRRLYSFGLTMSWEYSLD